MLPLKVQLALCLPHCAPHEQRFRFGSWDCLCCRRPFCFELTVVRFPGCQPVSCPLPEQPIVSARSICFARLLPPNVPCTDCTGRGGQATCLPQHGFAGRTEIAFLLGLGLSASRRVSFCSCC